MTDEPIDNNPEEVLYRHVRDRCLELAEEVAEHSRGKIKLTVSPTDLEFDVESTIFEVTPEVNQTLVDVIVSPTIIDAVRGYGSSLRGEFIKFREQLTENAVIHSTFYNGDGLSCTEEEYYDTARSFLSGLRVYLRANVSMKNVDLPRDSRKELTKDYINSKQAAWFSEIRCAVHDSQDYSNKWLEYASLPVDEQGFWVQTAKRAEMTDDAAIAANRAGTRVSQERNWKVYQ
jgi:hypothetical protein